MDEQTCCPHGIVVLKQHDHPGGTHSDYWECSDCKTRFFPSGVSHQTRRADFAGRAMQGLIQRLSSHECLSLFDDGSEMRDQISNQSAELADALIERLKQP